MTPLPGICLDQYATRAKELCKAARSADPAAAARIRQHHPGGAALAGSATLKLADCQLVVARETGYPSWATLKHHVLFLNALAAFDAGDLPALAALLRKHPTLVRYRCKQGEWYESGYFHGAMLLHHVAGNPIRQPIPRNILDLTRLLLQHGADPNAATGGGATTIGLLLTSYQASEAGVALPLVDLLREAGATETLDDPDVLSAPLLNVAPGTAAELVKRGARVDLRHAAGLGDLDRMRALLAVDPHSALREAALLFAAVRGETDAARVLVDHGARGDVLLTAAGEPPRTALHEAANRGHLEIVKLMLAAGASTRVVEPQFGGTPVGWAEHGGHAGIVDLLLRHRATE
jgi:ankyrin repeat protein